MSQMELIETFNPQPKAMVRSFYCAVCNKDHLQTGTLARVWVNYQEGYATQASFACFNAAKQSVQPTNDGLTHADNTSKPAVISR